MEVSLNKGCLFGDPYNKDYSILGSILGYLNVGILPYLLSGARAIINPKFTLKPCLPQEWVALKELKSSYYTGETLLFTIYTHYGNLIQVP